MRLLAACALTVSMLASPGSAQAPADAADQVPGSNECLIALAAARDRGSLDGFSLWPTLRAEAGDPRWPLDCSLTFRAAGLPLRPNVYAGETLNISRPVFTSPDTATLTIDSSRGLRDPVRTRYRLTRDAEGWRVTAREEEPFSGGILPLV